MRNHPPSTTRVAWLFVFCMPFASMPLHRLCLLIVHRELAVCAMPPYQHLQYIYDTAHHTFTRAECMYSPNFHHAAVGMNA
jgi:hypothetical protein